MRTAGQALVVRQPESSENLGRIDDDGEEWEPSSTTDGAAAAGEYDAAQGSPAPAHPTGAGHPDEAPKA